MLELTILDMFKAIIEILVFLQLFNHSRLLVGHTVTMSVTIHGLENEQ